MAHVNIEIKARCADAEHIRQILRRHRADFKGTDRQIDTYFKVKAGRLKLRRGNIENSLIFYDRKNQRGPKRADVSLSRMTPESAKELHETLTTALDVLVVVDKTREIYFIDNVKFHIDTVEGLGAFVEIEAIDESGTIPTDKLQSQCEYYMKLFGIEQSDLVEVSYSDLLLERKHL